MARTLKSFDGLVLASASPRRRELLSAIADNFEIAPADIDEDAFEISSPRRLVRALSRAKAERIAQADEYASKLVIAADTVVYMGKIYNKPADLSEAVEMLGELNGRWHSVYTGVTLIAGEEKITFSVRSRVKFKRLTKRELENYAATGSPLDKAGGYAIQDGVTVEKYRGSYTNIVGLPMEKLCRLLYGYGVGDGCNGTFDRPRK